MWGPTSRDEPSVQRGPTGEFEKGDDEQRYATLKDRTDDEARDQRYTGAQNPKSRPSVAQFDLAPPGDDC